MSKADVGLLNETRGKSSLLELFEIGIY